MPDDFSFDLPFRHSVFNSVEQQNLLKSITPKQARRAGIAAPTPILSIINDYLDEKVGRVMRQDPWDAFRAMRELRYVLHSLVYGVKHPEFKGLLETAETNNARIVEVLRQYLVKRYLDSDTPPDKRDEIQATLVEIIEAGFWPTWKAEVDSWGRPERWGSADDAA
jgi:hypothetical protein